MASRPFIVGDWGTTNLRLTLCDAVGTVLAQVSGPGAAQVRGRFDSAYAQLVEPWTQQHGPLPAVLCGMVGSTIGWVNVPYLPCPADPQQVADAMTAIDSARVRIAPGLTCRNRRGAPDVMRGEETQILGAIELGPALRRGIHLLCLPGTHTKWVVLNEGVVDEFLTSATGELYSLVHQHSVLIRAGDRVAGDASSLFDRGVERALGAQDAALAHLLFECRSRQIAGEFGPADASHFLSGLLIGQDAASATHLFKEALNGDEPVVVIGAAVLIELHARAFAALGLKVRPVDGSAASLAGLTALYRRSHVTEHADAR